MFITYCKIWLRAKKRPTEIWNNIQAASAHQSGLLYTVLLGHVEKPSCFLEINLAVKFIAVNFLDEELKDYLIYKFEGIGEERMFLSEVIYKEFKEMTGDVLKTTQYLFQQNGKLVIKEFNLVNQETIRKESINPVDISNNWEPVPQFGNYSSISSLDRELKCQ